MTSSSQSTLFQRLPQDVPDTQYDDDPLRPLRTGPKEARISFTDKAKSKASTQRENLWGVHWRSPVTMILFFLGATGCAIGHHFYYSRLDGTVVTNTSSRWDLESVRNGQEWAIRFGTAFAFLVKTLFAAAVAIAFQQRLWVTARKRTMSVAGLDAMFAAANSITSLTNFEFLHKAKVGAVLAILVWLIPLSALVTPATLTVKPSTISNSSTMPIPSINFSNIDPLFDYQSSVIGNDGTSRDNGITPYMSRLVSSTASTLQILPMNRAIINSTYKLKFHGPSLRCHKPSNSVNQAILAVLNATWFVSSGRPLPKDHASDMAWLAFAPGQKINDAVATSKKTPLSDSWLMFLNFVVTCITQPPMFKDTLPKIDSAELCEGIGIPVGGKTSLKNVSTVFPGFEYYNYGRIWVWAQNDTYDCILTDTEYDVGFSYSVSEKAQRINPNYSFRWTDNDLYGSYFPIANAISNLLGGAIRGYTTGIMSFNTRVSETAIFGAFRADTKAKQATPSGLAPVLLPPDIKALAQNKSVSELIEELSRNVTLSLFSAEKILSLNENKAVVNTTSGVNMYVYNTRILVLTYAAVWLLSLLGVIVGCVAYFQNGVSYDSSFSTFMLTTRNSLLDKLAIGHSMGSMPLADDIKDRELKFGLLLRDDDGGTMGHDNVRRVGFGFEDQVVSLQKGARYY
ncbi:hypothetical protein BGZ63DRAFT_503248 [Mariannaea sp. PMI_226]|nr:hypothetical protein BGZ63DRAFT_503248 [Mariannaea sp. PMI_226]